MEPPPNNTKTIAKTDETKTPIPYDQLNNTQRAYVDWKALNGLITDDEGNVRRMTVTELAEMVGITKSGMMQAARTIPNLWDLVNEQHKILAPQNRLQKVRDVWYLAALSPKNFQDRQLYLANFDPAFRMPAQKVEHEMGNSWAALLQGKEKPKQIENDGQAST